MHLVLGLCYYWGKGFFLWVLFVWVCLVWGFFLFLVRDCWLVYSVQFLTPTTPTANSHAVLLSSSTAIGIWSDFQVPLSPLLIGSNWFKIKAVSLLTPITMQKLFGIEWKRMCLSQPKDTTLQQNVCNKVSPTASSSFSFPRLKNRGAINTSALC